MSLHDVWKIISQLSEDGVKVSLNEQENQIDMLDVSGEKAIAFLCPVLQPLLAHHLNEDATVFWLEVENEKKAVQVYLKEQNQLIGYNLEDVDQGEISMFAVSYDEENDIEEKKDEEILTVLLQEIQNWNEFRMYFATQDMKIKKETPY